MRYRFGGVVAMVVMLAGMVGYVGAKPVVIEVVGQDNIGVDRANLQSAIDSAPDGATIQLRGVFQLDGTAVNIGRSHLTIEGVEQGKGKGKGKGTGNSDTLIKGLLEGDGTPQEDDPSGTFFNRGFQIFSEAGGVVEDITLRNFSLSGLNRGVAVTSFWQADVLCGSESVGAEVRDVTIMNLDMDNVIRGVQAFGSVNNLEITGNQITGAFSQGILLNGGGVGCVGLPGSFDAGSLFGVEITKNYASVATRNYFLAPFMTYGPNSAVLVSDNTFDGGSAAAVLSGHVTDFVVSKNLLMNGGSQGLDIYRFGGVMIGDGPASGFELQKNKYEDNVAGDTLYSPTLVPRDVWLQIDSSGNTVTEGRRAIVLDEGTNNVVTVKGK